MVEVANAISTAPEPAIDEVGKGHSPKDVFLCRKDTSWDGAEYASDCHPADGVLPWGERNFYALCLRHRAIFCEVRK